MGPAGIAAAFAGVSGGFCANFIPSAIDPLLQSFTQSAAQIIDPDIQVNLTAYTSEIYKESFPELLGNDQNFDVGFTFK